MTVFTFLLLMVKAIYHLRSAKEALQDYISAKAEMVGFRGGYKIYTYICSLKLTQDAKN